MEEEEDKRYEFEERDAWSASRPAASRSAT